MATFTEVPQSVLHLAQLLIARYHPTLRECNIGFVFRDEAAQAGGKAVFAKTSKIPDNLKPHLQNDLDMLIVIAEDQWSQLSSEGREALLDHELCHIALGENGWKLRGHDVEEFHEILERRGLWNVDLFRAGSALQQGRQLRLPIAEPEPEPAGSLTAVDPAVLSAVQEPEYAACVGAA